MQFKPFYNDWLDCSGMIAETGELNVVTLDKSFFENLKFDEENLKKYRTEAAIRCDETLGDNPALLLSGGVDSQAMVLCWHEAGLKFDVIIGVFKDDLNKQDSDHAKLFCETYNIPFKELKIDIVALLHRENYDIAERYRSYSPHFNVHYKIVEILAEQGYTGACFGGMTPFKRNGSYGQNFMGAPFHFLKIQDKLPIPMQGSFLSFSPELTWSIGLMCKDVVHEGGRDILYTPSQEELDILNGLRYKEKTESYRRTGLKVIPQEQKFTGFELVKERYAKKYNDGWTFENLFRHKLVMRFKTDESPYDRFVFKESEVLETLESIYLNNIRSCDGASTGV